MITTTGDMIAFALRASGILGVGQTASAEDANTGLQALADLVAQWNRKRWLTYVEQEVSVVTSTGAQYYTIGPGQQFNCTRPAAIKAAYVRILTGVPNLVDMSLEIIHSREEYAGISVKSLQTIPYVVFYDTQWPIGRVYFWPVPPAGMYGLYLEVQTPLPAYSTLVDPLNLPPEYYEALRWSLCVELQLMYGLPANPGHVAAMSRAMAWLRTANAQIPQLAVPVPAGRLRADASLVGPGLGRAFVLDQGAVL